LSASGVNLRKHFSLNVIPLFRGSDLLEAAFCRLYGHISTHPKCAITISEQIRLGLSALERKRTSSEDLAEQ
jgi:hypothetical protein